MKRIRVVLIEDHTIVREGIRMMLALDEQMDVVGEATSGEEGLRMVAVLKPDVVLMDIQMPGMDGLEATQRIKAEHPEVNVLILSSYGEEYLAQAIEAGASGYLLKSSTREELTGAIQAICEGQSPIDPALSRGLFSELASLSKVKRPTDLSERELRVLQLIAVGASSQEIAEQLFVSSRTVKRELHNIYNKLGVNERAHAVSEAYRRKLI